MSKFTEQELLTHPLMKKVQEDLAETRRTKEQEALANEMEASQLRANQGRYLYAQYEDAVNDYERLRVEMHAVVGRIFMSALEYSNLTRQPPPSHNENRLCQIDIPTLKPQNNSWSSTFSTTRAAITQFFSNGGRWL